MTAQRARRLYDMEVKWGKCGTGDMGRNNGKARAKKKARAHAVRLEKLRKLAGVQ